MHQYVHCAVCMMQIWITENCIWGQKVINTYLALSEARAELLFTICVQFTLYNIARTPFHCYAYALFSAHCAMDKKSCWTVPILMVAHKFHKLVFAFRQASKAFLLKNGKYARLLLSKIRLPTHCCVDLLHKGSS